MLTVHAPPAWQEWLRLVLVLLAGVGCRHLGRDVARGGGKARYTVAAAGGAAALAGVVLPFAPELAITRTVSAILGSARVLSCLGGLALLGLAAGSRGGPHAIAQRALAAAAMVAIISFNYGPFCWIYADAQARVNYPDREGRMGQTTRLTCSPAAGAMLLHRYGIRISEGEMAQLANTNPWLGTDVDALAIGVGRAARPAGLRCRLRRGTYDDALRLHRPFITSFTDPNGAEGHSVLVERVEPDCIWLLDPLGGQLGGLSRRSFEKTWDRYLLWLE